MQAATVKDGAREGRGYSLEELQEAGLDARTARKNGVPTDVWRKTKYSENVEQLKSIIKSMESPKEKPAAKKEEKRDAKPKTVKKAGKKKEKKKTKKKGKK